MSQSSKPSTGANTIPEWKFPEQSTPSSATRVSPRAIQALQYTLAKQLPTVHTLHTDYGSILLDDELAQAVEGALEPIFTQRLEMMEVGA